MKVFDQGQKGQCAGYAFLTALYIMNPHIDSEKIHRELQSESVNLFTIPRAGEWFKARGHISKYEPIKPIQIKGLLNRRVPLISGSNLGDFSKCTKDNRWTLPFDKDMKWFQHKYCLVTHADQWIVAQNSWSDQWGDRGLFYIDQKDFAMLNIPYRIYL